AASFLAGSVINNALAISGFTAGIMLGMYGLGVLVKSSHQTGALIGMVLGLAILSFVFVYTTVAWPWYSFIGFTSTFLFGGLFSLLIPRRNSV
ncbi:MAG: hypothetical protein KDA68_22110, partial [Planctomycetaceae bacterium]|nr:hypothetical protein [Planctomycetaceae bacterium]